MLIGRCAWHRQYYGYPALSGIASWRGLSLRFTDGICPRCATQFRTEHQRYLERRSVSAVAGVRRSSRGTAA
jgi:hypothetical protein